MSGINRLTVAEITKSGVKGPALVKELEKMITVNPPKEEVKKKKK